MALESGGWEGERRASGRHDSRFGRRGVPPRGSIPAPTFSLSGRPDAKEEREPGTFLLVFFYFKNEPNGS